MIQLRLNIHKQPGKQQRDSLRIPSWCSHSAWTRGSSDSCLVLPTRTASRNCFRWITFTYYFITLFNHPTVILFKMQQVLCALPSICVLYISSKSHVITKSFGHLVVIWSIFLILKKSYRSCTVTVNQPETSLRPTETTSKLHSHISVLSGLITDDIYIDPKTLWW